MLCTFPNGRERLMAGSVEVQLLIHLCIFSILVLKEAVSVVQHLLQGSEEQYVGVLVQLQLFTVVLHRQHTGQRDTKRLAQLPCLGGRKTESGLSYQHQHNKSTPNLAFNCVSVTFLWM